MFPINLIVSLFSIFPPFFLHCIIEKARKFQKVIYFCFIDSTKGFDCEDHNKIWKILQEIGRITCLLRNLSAGQGEIKSVSPKGNQP